MRIFDLFRRPHKVEELSHSGTPHDGAVPHSGRYPYGSGKNPGQLHDKTDLVSNVTRLKKEGLTDKEIQNSLGISSTEYRKLNTLSVREQRKIEDDKIFALKQKGWGDTAIAIEVFNDASKESTVRYRLSEKTKERTNKTNQVIEDLKTAVDKDGFIDIGVGAETALGISRTRLLSCAKALEEEGYVKDKVRIQQMGTANKTEILYLAKPGTTKGFVYNNIDDLGELCQLRGSDGGKTALGIKEPTSVGLDRVYVRYNEEGGKALDGTIYLRRGVKDIDLGDASYAQVRIKVEDEDGHAGYMKGMALYSDDIPDGYDIVYNSNRHPDAPLFKEKGETRDTVFKKLKDDEDNPFGTTLRMKDGKIVGQKEYIDDDGEVKLSPINIVREEGDWNEWSKTLASQFLGKQPIQLIKQQLDLTIKQTEEEYDEIMSLDNPVIKEKLLISFADSCDSSSVHLKAAALPRQASKVILPINSLKDNEIYAPTYEDGEEVILVRYPHGGTFEIPKLIVNNHNPEAQKNLGNAIDAVGININAASKLSGADFDGDTALVIPTKNQKLTVTDLEGLADFEPKELYKIPDYLSPEERDKLTMKNTQMEMGKISNLITDMTLLGAPPEELARAVRHSMVVIDAEKHGLDYKKSYKVERIDELKEKWQGGGGVSTILSRAKSPEYVLDRKPAYSVNQLDDEQKNDYLEGKKVYIDTGKTKTHPVEPNDLAKQYGKKNLKAIKGIWYVKNEDGSYTSLERKVDFSEPEEKTIKVPRMTLTDDAMTLIHDPDNPNPKELEYANYANKMKQMANTARKEAMNLEMYSANKSAKEAYKDEVESLENKLLIAEMNRPLERKAQAIANVIYRNKKEDNIFMDEDEDKKVRTQSLVQARNITGASKKDSAIQITDKEWEAIQAHAISPSKLKQIIANTDEDKLKKLATPRSDNELSATTINTIKNYYNNGVTIAEIASALGVSTSTVVKYIK